MLSKFSSSSITSSSSYKFTKNASLIEFLENEQSIQNWHLSKAEATKIYKIGSINL